MRSTRLCDGPSGRRRLANNSALCSSMLFECADGLTHWRRMVRQIFDLSGKDNQFSLRAPCFVCVAELCRHAGQWCRRSTQVAERFVFLLQTTNTSNNSSIAWLDAAFANAGRFAPPLALDLSLMLSLLLKGCLVSFISRPGTREVVGFGFLLTRCDPRGRRLLPILDLFLLSFASFATILLTRCPQLEVHAQPSSPLNVVPSFHRRFAFQRLVSTVGPTE